VEKAHQIIRLAAEGAGVRATARLLGLSKNTVNLAIEKVGDHCRVVFRSLMRDLRMNEVQMDELWAFVKRKRLLTSSSKAKAKPGSGRP
jgi:hypothetical protein